MKILSYVTAIGLALFIANATPVWSQEDYSFVSTAGGSQICLGTWVPPTAIGEFGVCEGQMIGFPQLTAISSRQSVEKLDQLLAVLTSIDEKLDVNNRQISVLIEATYDTQASIDQQVKQFSEFLRETIDLRLDSVPSEMIANKAILRDLIKLREDILKEVEKRYPAVPAPSPK